MSFKGKDLHYNYIFPKDESIWGEKGVSYDFNIHVDPANGGNLPLALMIGGKNLFAISVKDDFIKIDFEATALFATHYSAGTLTYPYGFTYPVAFNGIWFSDKLEDAIEGIRSFADISLKTNIRGLTNDDLKYDKNQIKINLEGVTVTEDSYIELTATFKSEMVQYERATATSYVGQEGIDTVVYSGPRASYKLRPTDAGIALEKPNKTSDTFSDIERLQFSDGTLAFDKDGNAGQAYRLYQAAFDRVPGPEEIGYWVKELDLGTSDLSKAALNFIFSEEFKSKYGTPETVSDQDFLALLYQNVLDRAPDADGFPYWTGELNSGLAREFILVAFSESAENRLNVADAISDGIWYV